ncbi:MAG TPA: hypothetical protein VFS00_10555, partial [Polyangiaceae bacterium]|nr:hypothetical protein [Polyangiaceae bacterium]
MAMRRILFRFTLGAACSALAGLSGCGDSSDEVPPYEPKITWGACEEPFDTMDECGTFQAPLDWSDPDREKIDVFLARKKARSAPRGQLWLLQGGPGSSGGYFSYPYGERSEVDRLSAALPDLDIYVFEHRGVGLSTRLYCPRPPGQFRATTAGGAFAQCLS